MRLNFTLLVLLASSLAGFSQTIPHPATPPSGASPKSRLRQYTSLPSGCPDYTGPLSSIGVPVGQSVDLVVLSGAAPAGGITWNVFSNNPSIVAAGNPTQGFIPQVFTPEGQTFSSVFTLYGVAVGETNLIVQEVSPGGGSFPTPMTAWAVNPQGASNFVDANFPGNSCLTPGTPNLSTDAGTLSACGGDVNGTVSDGVSQLLLRVAAGLQGTACYTITSTSSSDQGFIASQVVPTQGSNGLNYGFSFYQAPAEYGAGDTSDNRQVSVQFAFAPSFGNSNTTTISGMLTVIRPPLVLIHGLWSNQGAWSGGSANWFRPGPFNQTYAADYASTNGSNFSTNFPSVQDWVASGLEQARDAGFAATQADVVGHSMGGILTRLYAASPDYLRNDNFNLGDIHRLVTLDTPHSGSTLANLIVSLNANSLVFAAIGSVVTGIASVFDQAGNIDSGAICDLAENSPALKGMNGATNVPSQMVTGTGGPAGTPSAPAQYFPPVEGILTKQLCVFGHCASIFPQNVVNGFRFLQPNDEIVGLTSQQALVGLGASYQTNYAHTQVEKQADVATQTFSLLDGPITGFVPSLPGVNSNGLGNPVTVPGTGAKADQTDYASQCVGLLAPLGPLLPLSDQAGGEHKPQGRAQRPSLPSMTQTPDARVQITTPTNNQHFAPGDTVAVTVQITSPLTLSVGWVGVNIPGIGPIEGTNFTANTFTASFTIPANFAGPATLTPAILDSNGNPYLGVSTAIAVVPTIPPTALSVQQPFTHLKSASATASIYVIGSYPGGIQRNLTSSVTGTTYASSNASVLTVDANGNVQAKAFGTAAVTVRNSGLTTFANFVIENPAAPLAAQDVTSSLNISLSGFQLNRNTGFYVQTATLANALSVPVSGPLYLVFSGLPNGVNLTNSGSGLTRSIAPLGAPYLKLQLPSGLTLQPGASISLTLQFLNPTRVRIGYTPKVFRTIGTP